MSDIEKELIDYANGHRNGFTVAIKKGKICEIIPSNDLHYVTAINTIITIDNYTNKQSIVTYPFIDKIDKDYYAGGWLDKKEDVYYVEIVNIFEHKIDAILLGNSLREYSIYDLLENKEIVIEDEFYRIKHENDPE